MNSRNSYAVIVMACSLAVGFLGIAPAASAASAKKSVVKGRSYVLEHKHRAPRIFLPVGPSTVYYDYPYYYSRGYYPTHIVHYVYYHPYYYRGDHHRGSRPLHRYKARRR